MTIKYLKKAPLHSRSDDTKTKQIVSDILNDIEAGGDEKALEYAAKFDKYDGEIIQKTKPAEQFLLIRESLTT